MTTLYIAIGVLVLIAISYYFYMRYKEKKKESEAMPAGLQCFDANGNMSLDLTDNLSYVLGTYDINVVVPYAGYSGTINTSLPSGCHIWLYIICIKLGAAYFNTYINGSTITFNLTARFKEYQESMLPAEFKTCAYRIIYGVY